MKILFVCLGNICRSPMAEAIMKNLIAQNYDDISVDSKGTSGYHNGEQAHYKTLATLHKHNIKFTNFRSSQLKSDDYLHYDYIIAMDDSNLKNIKKIFQQHNPNYEKITNCKIKKLLNYDVPDPWYSDNFEETYQLCLMGCNQLLNEIKRFK